MLFWTFWNTGKNLILNRNGIGFGPNTWLIMTAAAATTNAAAPSSADQNHVKRLEKEYRKDLTAQTNVKDGEMCANCFVLEKTLLDESNHHGRFNEMLKVPADQVL
jgi:hypothetical protein